MPRTYVRKNPPANYISLIDGGFWARFTRKEGGKIVNIKHKIFRFERYDFCPTATREAAQRWVAYWAPRLKKPITTDTRPKLFRTKPKGAKQKRAGVSLVVSRKVRKNGAVYEHYYWQTMWSMTVVEDGKQVRKGKRRSFAFDKNDPKQKKKQYERACKHREEMEAKHYAGPLIYTNQQPSTSA